jgi:hypothetical protein
LTFFIEYGRRSREVFNERILDGDILDALLNDTRCPHLCP